jgi:hypothetical protein
MRQSHKTCWHEQKLIRNMLLAVEPQTKKIKNMMYKEKFYIKSLLQVLSSC